MSDNKGTQPAQAGLLLPFWLCCLDFSKGQSGIKLMESLRMLLRGFSLPAISALFCPLQLRQILNTLKILDRFFFPKEHRQKMLYVFLKKHLEPVTSVPAPG